MSLKSDLTSRSSRMEPLVCSADGTRLLVVYWPSTNPNPIFQLKGSVRVEQLKLIGEKIPEIIKAYEEEP